MRLNGSNLLRTSTFKTDLIHKIRWWLAHFPQDRIQILRCESGDSRPWEITVPVLNFYLCTSVRAFRDLSQDSSLKHVKIFLWQSVAVPCSPSDVPSRSRCLPGPTLPRWQCCWADPLLHSEERPRDLKNTHTETHICSFEPLENLKYTQSEIAGMTRTVHVHHFCIMLWFFLYSVLVKRCSLCIFFYTYTRKKQYESHYYHQWIWLVSSFLAGKLAPPDETVLLSSAPLPLKTSHKAYTFNTECRWGQLGCRGKLVIIFNPISIQLTVSRVLNILQNCSFKLLVQKRC